MALRFRTDTDLPLRLGADINDPVTTIGTDASRTSNRYWFENYEHATCVDCNLMNQVTPVVNITGNSDFSEGDSVFFALTDDPPGREVAVDVKIAAQGDYGVVTGYRTVMIPASGILNLFLPTEDDEKDELDGSATLTILPGDGYSVGTKSTETSTIRDNDASHVFRDEGTPLEKYADLIARIKTDLQSPNYRGEAHDLKRVLKTLGVPEYANSPGGEVSVGEATNRRTKPHDNPHWEGIAEALQYKIAYDVGTLVAALEVSISGGSGITEGGDASFTISANPAPARPTTVNIGVSQSGSWGASGASTVSVSGASTSYTITTSDDQVDETDGSVTATVQSGSGYTVGTAATASVNVADDDAAPVVVPEITISGGSGITEGGTASFTISASPAPTSPITVKIGVSQSGSFGASGSATVSVSGASTTYTITTSDDQVDEPNGSVTATVQSGTGYTVGTTSTATVNVAADDDPVVEDSVTISISDASASESASDLVFRVTLSEASTKDITVGWRTLGSNDPDRRAHPGQDFWELSGEIRIRAGETSGTGAVWLNQDSQVEPDELFTVYLYAPVGATLDRDEATMTIIDDD